MSVHVCVCVCLCARVYFIKITVIVTVLRFLLYFCIRRRDFCSFLSSHKRKMQQKINRSILRYNFTTICKWRCFLFILSKIVNLLIFCMSFFIFDYCFDEAGHAENQVVPVINRKLFCPNFFKCLWQFLINFQLCSDLGSSHPSLVLSRWSSSTILNNL